MMRKTAEERYQLNLNQQKRKIDDFIIHETEWANDLILWYRLKKIEIPDDVYRGCAFFINKEYLNKKGSINLLYQTHLACNKELPVVTKENAFDVVRFKYKTYAHVLKKGGFS
jgi:hypothetical protein